MQYSYEILPRPVELGSGWRLRLLEGDVEVGGGVFPPMTDSFANPADALQAAYYDAESEAYAWLQRFPGHLMDTDFQSVGLFADALEEQEANTQLEGYSYEITPFLTEVGKGWRLRLLDNGKEVGGGIFPPLPNFEYMVDALKVAFFKAEDEAHAWLDSKGAVDIKAQLSDLNLNNLEAEAKRTIAEDERRRRQAAIDFALANVGLSGFTPSEEVQDRMRRFIDGEINLDEFVKGLMDHAKREV
jgi:hypothetical protein